MTLAARPPPPTPQPPAVAGMPRALLRIEAMGLLVAAVVAMPIAGAPWWPFAVAAIAPDLSMLGYLGGRRLGALAYNAAHTTLGPLCLAAWGIVFAAPIAAAAGLGWLAHIGFDRALGYGLKYPTGFVDTHLGRLGRDE